MPTAFARSGAIAHAPLLMVAALVACMGGSPARAEAVCSCFTAADVVGYCKGSGYMRFNWYPEFPAAGRVRIRCGEEQYGYQAGGSGDDGNYCFTPTSRTAAKGTYKQRSSIALACASELTLAAKTLGIEANR